MKLDEFVDLVDENGSVKLRGLRRSEVKQRKEEFLAIGLYQPIVIVVVIDSDAQVVVQVRGKGKSGDGGGAIDHVCGVISAGERWEQAARREAAEEISVELAGLDLIDQRVNGFGRHRTLAVARPVGEPKVIDSIEVASVFTATPRDLQAMAAADRVFIDGFFSDLALALDHLGYGS